MFRLINDVAVIRTKSGLVYPEELPSDLFWALVASRQKRSGTHYGFDMRYSGSREIVRRWGEIEEIAKAKAEQERKRGAA